MKRVAAATVAAAVTAIIATSVTAFAMGAVHQTSDVYRFDNMADVGDATLVRNASGVSMTIRSSVEGELTEFGALLGEDFTPGDATTNWWVVFNHPGNCSDGVCGEDDVLDALLGGDPNNVLVDILFATGHIANSQWQAGASLREGDTGGSLRPGFGLEPIGLIDSMAAEIHIVVRSHGPASDLAAGEIAGAISSVDGGCLINTCGDPQFAVFLAPPS
jgi:hypothetical protein